MVQESGAQRSSFMGPIMTYYLCVRPLSILSDICYWVCVITYLSYMANFIEESYVCALDCRLHAFFDSFTCILLYVTLCVLHCLN